MKKQQKGAVRHNFQTDMRETKPRVKRTRGRPPTFPVDVAKVNPLALATAKQMAGGDASRLRMLKDGSVVVQNRGKA